MGENTEIKDRVIRRMARSDHVRAAEIVRALPEFFTDDVPAKVEASSDGFVITEGDELVGFATVERRSPQGAEITWMAIDPAHRGQRLGTRLLDHVLGHLAREGVGVVEVKTLDPSANYEPYVATRAFWEGRGFVQVDTIDPYPGWQPGNPAAIYVAALRSTV